LCWCFDSLIVAGRRLHNIGSNEALASSSAAPDYLDMATFASTAASAVQGDNNSLTGAPNSIQHAGAATEQQQVTLTPIHITPTLNMAGKPATVLPMDVVRTTWEGHDATYVAACLSRALLTMRSVSLLAPPATLAELGLQQHAATLAGGLLPQL
jgi:hypothetical protein